MTTGRRVALAILATFTVSLVIALAVHGKIKSGSGTQQQRASSANYDIHQYDDSLICNVELTLMSLNSGGDEEDLECFIVYSPREEDLQFREMTIAIDLPLSFVYDHRKALDEGKLYVKIPGGYVEKEIIVGFGPVGTTVHIPAGAELEVLDEETVSTLFKSGRPNYRQRRRRDSTTSSSGGKIRSVLVFRVTTDDASPNVAASEIQERMFSTTAFSFASQYEKCSFGELTFEAFDPVTPVSELYVPGAVSSFTERTILNAATAVVNGIYGDDIFQRVDHAVFCMPPGTSGKGYIAYSGVGSFFSVFHDSRCSYPTTVMHEIAHNIGLGHAFENGEEYGDETSIMGFSSSSKTGPSKCFNGQNLWQLGWFQNRSLMVDPFQGTQLIELSPFVDFEKTRSDQAVLITVFDMHIVYNRAKGFNAETSEYKDKVTITKEENRINSELVAVRDLKNPTFTVPEFLATVNTLIIELCESTIGAEESEADYYTLSIGLDHSRCPELMKPPTPSPTDALTPSPSYHQPTTIEPSSPPSLQPSSPPSLQPSSPPSLQPSYFQTASPTYLEETANPTFAPTEEQLPGFDIEELPPLTDAPDVLIFTAPPEIHPPPKLTSLPTFPPRGGVNGFNGGASMTKAPDSVSIIFAAVSLGVFVGSCAILMFSWHQRRMDEQKRNLRILQYNASSQVKLYMQDPV